MAKIFSLSFKRDLRPSPSSSSFSSFLSTPLTLSYSIPLAPGLSDPKNMAEQ